MVVDNPLISLNWLEWFPNSKVELILSDFLPKEVLDTDFITVIMLGFLNKKAKIPPCLYEALIIKQKWRCGVTQKFYGLKMTLLCWYFEPNNLPMSFHVCWLQISSCINVSCKHWFQFHQPAAKDKFVWAHKFDQNYTQLWAHGHTIVDVCSICFDAQMAVPTQTIWCQESQKFEHLMQQFKTKYDYLCPFAIGVPNPKSRRNT